MNTRPERGRIAEQGLRPGFADGGLAIIIEEWIRESIILELGLVWSCRDAGRAVIGREAMRDCGMEDPGRERLRTAGRLEEVIPAPALYRLYFECRL
jgi:hypothetical protein